MQKLESTSLPLGMPVPWSAFVADLGLPLRKTDPATPCSKNRSGYEGIRVVEKRMLVGIFETKTKTWFFKLMGPVDQVAATESTFKKFLTNLKFVKDAPTWTLPDRWSDGGKRPMRHATLLIPTDAGDSLELAISNLDSGQDLVLNANRWLGQLDLPSVNQESIGSVISDAGDGDDKFLMFDATGSGSGQMTPGQPPKAPPAASKRDVEFELIDGWEEGNSNSIVKVRLIPKSNPEDGLITVVRMPADANEWVPNVQRWCGQVDANWDENKIEELTESITVDQIEGNLIRLVNEIESDKRIVGVMVKKDQHAWFIKLMGSKSLVNSSTDDFLKFCKSLKLPGS